MAGLIFGTAFFAPAATHAGGPARASAPPAGPSSAPVVPSRPALPSPYRPGPEESAHDARYNKAIAPVAGTRISENDAKALRETIKALSSGNAGKAADLKQGISDPTAAKIADWFRLRGGFGTADELRAFLNDNPSWPDRLLLRQRVEEALFKQGGNPAEIRAQFAKDGPQTAAGHAALASAALAEGNTEEARTWASKAWREKGIPATLEAAFFQRFGSLLTVADHKARLDRLIIDDVRYKADRAERAAVVRRLLPLLPEGARKAGEARLAVFLQQDGAAAAIAAVPAGDTPDWGLTFHKIQALRRSNRIDEAARLMQKAPTAAGSVVNPDDWWTERRALAYAALRTGKPKLAYDLVRETAPLSVNPLKEQTFMAGWLALRYLKDPATAKVHFEALRKAADGPLSRAKAAYWLGRVADLTGDAAGAKAFYTEATRDPDTFHGQLSLLRLSPGARRFTVAAPEAPTDDDISRFNSADVVKAAVIANRAKLDRSVQRAFLEQLRFVFKSEAGMAMVAHLAEEFGDTQMAVRTAKAAIGDRKNLFYYSYPVHPFPAYTPLRKPPEPAFLLGIARQETEFNTLTVSGAGAKGLLQVMTITAQHVCRDYKITCDIPRLLSDPAYNTTMGSAYIADRMDDFLGSYVLTLAGYNAGPGRARQWIAEFGDPRDPKIDPIDWIERIPIQETREYVAKVLSNIQVYRARLGESETALRLDQDLKRAQRTAGAAGAPANQTAADTAP